MPTIRPSADLRNKYLEISEFCHNSYEPVFITKNGQGDLAVMSIETYEMIIHKMDLYKKINEGLIDIKNGNTEDAFSALNEIRRKSV
jgi:PHD/YefM family antitoxin component YafN of YafNO toxin-antitoxin module